MMSCEYHEQYLENKLDMWREEIYTEYEKYFSPEEINILQRIMFDELDMDTMKEKMIDFFNDNPCPSEDLISGEQYFDMLDYINCSDKELKERLMTDLGA